MLLSGVIGAALDRLSVKAATNETYLDSTVTTAEMSVGRFRQSGDAALIARARELVLIYATLNARVCSGQMLRLYTAKKGKKTKTVTARKRREYLHSHTGVGVKAARWADMAGDIEEVMDHDALRLLNNPNPWMRGTTFLQAMFMQWELFGRRYVHVVGEGEPDELWLMGAQSTKIIPSRDGLIAGFRYGRSGETEEDFGVDEVLYQRMFPSPFNPYDALGPLQMVVDAVDTYTAATTAELASWQNGARPDFAILPHKEVGYDEKQAKQLESRLNANHRGPRNRGKLIVLSGANMVEPLNFTPKEMEYLAGKQDLRKTIRSAYGVPESIDELNSANLASAMMGHAQYAKYTIQPRINQDAEEWTETLLPLYGIEPGEMWFAYDSAIPSDRAELRADAVAYIPQGVWSVNEARAEMGWDALPDKFADNHLPSSLLTFASSATQPQAAATDAATQDPEKPTTQATPQAADTTAKDTALNGAQVASLVEVAAQIANGQLPEKVGLEILLAAFPGIDPSRINRIIAGLRNFTPDAPAASGATGRDAGKPGADDEEDDAPPSDLKSAPAPACECGKCSRKERKARARVVTKDDRQTQASVEAAMQRDVEKWFASVASAKPNEAGIVNMEPFERELEKILRPHIVQMFQVGSEAGLRAIGQSVEDAFSIYPDRAVGFLSQYSVRLTREISDTVKERFSAGLSESIVEGEPLVDRTARVMSVLKEEAPWRAERIARTETAVAMVEGQREAWKANGIDKVEWLVSSDACPFCKAMGERFNKEQDINTPFLNVGDTLTTGTGESMTVTHRAVTGPPLHPNCTCDLVPVTGY